MDVACSSHSQLLCIQLKHFRNSLIISLSCSLLMRTTQRPNNPFKRWPSLTPDPPPPAAPQPRLPVNLRIEHPVIECTWAQMWCLMNIHNYTYIYILYILYIFMFLFTCRIMYIHMFIDMICIPNTNWTTCFELLFPNGKFSKRHSGADRCAEAWLHTVGTVDEFHLCEVPRRKLGRKSGRNQLIQLYMCRCNSRNDVYYIWIKYIYIHIHAHILESLRAWL